MPITFFQSAELKEQRLLFALAAFLGIFAVYLLGTKFLPDLRLLYVELSPREGPIPPSGRIGTEVRDLIFWWAFALLGIVLSIVVTGWSAMLLIRYCPPAVHRSALLLFGGAAALAGILAHGPGNEMVELTQRHSCTATSTQLFCLTPAKNKAGDYTKLLSQAEGMPDATAFGREFNATKTVLNGFLQMAAIFVIGTMLTITAICFRDEARSTRHFTILVSEKALRNLFIAGGVVLSMTTLTDVLFTHWPINAFGGIGSRQGKEVAALLSALTFYYAVLGSIVLALGLIFARTLAMTPLPLFNIGSAAAGDGAMPRLLSFFTRKSTLNALIALSPMLTFVASNPLIKESLEALSS